MVAICILQEVINPDMCGGVRSAGGGKNMEIERLEDLDGVDTLFQAYFIFDNLHIDKLIKKKDNGKSIRFEVISERYHRLIDNPTFSSHKRTIKKEKILYSKIPFFTTRDEAIDWLIEGNKDKLEYCKKQMEQIPLVIEFLEKLKAKQTNLMEYAKR